MTKTPPYTLVRRAAAGSVPLLDPGQRAVAAHRGGPLLVLAGPGTGKTTTLVEAVLGRLEGPDAVRPEEILVLTFSRAAAAELRDRIGARLGGTGGVPGATTFHSFCFALLGRFKDPALFSEPLRLLSGPEQDVVIRELVRGTIDPLTGWQAPGGGADEARWPAALRAALGTRGFAEELRAVLLRAREQGLDPARLRGFAEQADRPDWRAAARFFAEYLDVTDARGVLDYAELVHRAVILAETPEVREQLRAAYRVVFVDEYQDTDPAQVRLLEALAGDGRELVVVGDPDQSIYAFRGADLHGILEFPDRFRTGGGEPAPIAVLRTSRRSGPTLLRASRRVARRMPLTRLPAEKVREHRELSPAEGAPDTGSVSVLTFPAVAIEQAALADLLRRAHLEDGVDWADMAVLARTGAQLASLRRALTMGNVPVEVRAEQLPLAREPAVATLLLALRCAADPSALTTETARTLLTGPLAGLDSGDLRRLGRALRAEESLAGARPEGEPAAPPRPADQLIREAVADPAILAAVEPSVGGAARDLALLLRAASQALANGGVVEDALWVLWHGTAQVPSRWPARLRRAVDRGGAAGRLADRDLDAVIALFALAARAQERTGHAGVTDFISGLQAQDLAADTLADKAERGGAVQLMTAHASKGLQWRLVVVAGVQEGLWPDLRHRGSLLDADRIGRLGLTDPLSTSALLAEERRLFYVAVTRARERLVVSAVQGEGEDGETPSRFLTELGVEPVAAAFARQRPLRLTALLAELRRYATAPAGAVSEELRQAAVLRLARIAAAEAPDGARLAPNSEPEHWWGLYERTDNPTPIVRPDLPVPLSASAVEALDACPLRWFLERPAAAQEQSTDKQGFGLVFHALAEEVATGATPADIDVLMDRLDRVWDRLPFEARWQSDQERRAARRALERFLVWHGRHRDGRKFIAAEREFDTTLAVGGVDVRLHGYIDRVEVNAQGQVFLVDFKTGKTPKTPREAEKSAQLAVYQLAAESAGIGETAGAELVYPRDEADSAEPTVRVQPPLREQQDPAWAPKLLAEVAGTVLKERFHASGDAAVCQHCALRRACPRQPEGRELPL
ncbi:ATP-dependent helicase [Actinospica sp. MGRD01-02]|uniref:DNA 3'-5' helicase n=1 Tax=Actinospica acidithermotolerans TaxID=2828514 RepID=A0A941IKJ6_9ACTN|nr:ATP-dependent DNA helicase [Actinospica acidithermotolerans]MBR7829002.1 ATP-dependent helicase [Actinospica acidithermotolerans]